ncbi:MAG: LPS-assembly protein LptD [Rhodothermales bacterium]|nr:LPS-assembly protein LptD [Rhodothermales bacterium]
MKPRQTERSRDPYRLRRYCTTAAGQFSIFALLFLLSTSSSLAQSEQGEGIIFSAADSLVIMFDDSTGDFGSLFGSSSVTHKSADLAAYQIDILFDRDELRASGLASDTGTVGLPEFTQGSETFRGSSLAFNMTTERGRVVGAQTVYEDGFIRADVAKFAGDSTLFIKDGLYTTCDCFDDPSYSLRSNRMKIVDRKWVYTGPIRLYLFNIPTPLWLPFGFLPAQEGRRSGPLAPKYGEDEFGFYLRSWGYYWALSDYLDLQLQGGFWSRGSWESASSVRYNRRYKYNGQLQVEYARLRRGEKNDPSFSINQTSSVRWSHAQTISPSSSLSANVDLSTSGYLRAISEDYTDRVRQTVGSSVTYRKRWAGVGRSLTFKTSQQQSFANNTVDLTIPSLSFSQSSRKPFSRSKVPGRGEAWFEKITYSYNMTTTNRFNFVPLSEDALNAAGDSTASNISWTDALFSASDYRRATGRDAPFAFKTSHSIPVSASFAAGPLNLTPQFSFSEDWFLRTDRRSLDSTNKVITQSEAGFFALHQFSTGVNANTTVYGLFPVNIGRYQGMRHTVRPKVGFSYRPDFLTDTWGYSRTYTDANGDDVRYPLVSEVRSGKQQTLNYSVSNVFETRSVEIDSSGTDRSKTVTLLNLDLSSAYNFAAEQQKMRDITISARSKILGKVDVTGQSSISPYASDSTGSVTDNYIFDPGSLVFGRIKSFRATARTSLRSRSRGSARPVENLSAIDRTGNTSPLSDRNDQFNNSRFSGGVDGVQTDFAIPWSMSLDFTYSYSKPGLESTRRAIVNTSFDFNLTPNWKVTARSGYDISENELVTTSLYVHRDFECWQMSINWIPFGTFQSWGFDLHVKSGHLRDLLRLRQPKSDVSGRFDTLL